MPLLFFAIPFAAVILINLSSKKAGMKIAFWSAFTVASLQIIMAVAAVSTLIKKTDNIIMTQSVMTLSIDFLSAVVLFTIGLVAAVSLILYRAVGKPGDINFLNLLLLIITGMNGITMVTDMFSLYVFLEVTSAASFILIAIRKRKGGLEGAFKYYILSAIATIMLLSSISLILMLTGDTSFSAVSEYIAGFNSAYPLQIIISFVLFTSGLCIKAGLVPFHDWVADAYSSSPAPVSVLLAGIVTKVCGVYTIMRVFRDVFNNASKIGIVLIILGLASIIIGAFAAIGEKDFKRMLAYSSISQIGYIILGVGTGSALGFMGALLHFFNHAVFKSLLFINSTAVELQTGTRDMDRMGGLSARMPVTGSSSVLAFLSTAGIPPLSGFWSKLIIIIAAWNVSVVAAGIALFSSIITLAYFLRLQKKVFFGKLENDSGDIRECSGGIVNVEILLSAITVAMGVFFPFILEYLQGKGWI